MTDLAGADDAGERVRRLPSGVPPPGWEVLATMFAGSGWSEEGKRCGIWALGVLREELGDDWVDTCWQTGSLPAELALAAGHLHSFALLVDLAAELHLLRARPGMASVRRKFQTNPVPHELAAARCSLRIAAVGLRAGLVPTMEPAARGRSPADVSLEGPDGELRVEAKTLLRAELTRDVDAWLDVLTTPLMESVRIHRVRINGEANEPLDEASTVTLIADLTAACGAVAAGVSVPAVRAGRNRFEVVPAGSDQPATNIAMPAVNLWRRTAARITEAVGQTRRSGATWLLVESLDNLWQLTPWSTQTLASRAIALREEALRLVEDVQHLHGVVFTDGAALIDLHSPDERTNPVAGVFGIRQRIDRPRTRETIVIALRDDTAVADLREWQRVLEAEAGWAQWALDRVGLPSPPELRPLH